MAGTGETPNTVYVVIERRPDEARRPMSVVYPNFEEVVNAFGRNDDQKAAIRALTPELNRRYTANITFDQGFTTLYIEKATMAPPRGASRRRRRTLRHNALHRNVRGHHVK